MSELFAQAEEIPNTPTLLDQTLTIRPIPMRSAIKRKGGR